MMFRMQLKAPTVNQMYSTFRGHRVKSKAARDFAKDVENLMKSIPLDNIEGELIVIIKIYSRWYNKNGTIKKKDIANFEKAIIDSIFSNLEMDDSQIFELKLQKIHSETEEFEVLIMPR